MQDEITSVEQSLNLSFKQTKGNARTTWLALDKQLQDIQKGLKDGTISLLDALDQAINSLKKDIQYG